MGGSNRHREVPFGDDEYLDLDTYRRSPIYILRTVPEARRLADALLKLTHRALAGEAEADKLLNQALSKVGKTATRMERLLAGDHVDDRPECHQCGRRQGHGGPFCGWCGTPMLGAPPTEPPQKVSWISPGRPSRPSPWGKPADPVLRGVTLRVESVFPSGVVRSLSAPVPKPAPPPAPEGDASQWSRRDKKAMAGVTGSAADPDFWEKVRSNQRDRFRV